MHRVTSITPADLKVLDHWKKAPIGALVQVTAKDGTPIVGMRCELKPRDSHKYVSSSWTVTTEAILSERVNSSPRHWMCRRCLNSYPRPVPQAT